MPLDKHKIKGTISKRIYRGKITRYRYVQGVVHHKGKLVRQRLGFRNNKVVEVSFIPYSHERRRL